MAYVENLRWKGDGMSDIVQFNDERDQMIGKKTVHDERFDMVHPGQVYNDEHNCWVDVCEELPCGSSSPYDGDFSYVCNSCGAVAGSVGRPNSCIEVDKKNEMWEILKK